MASGLLLCEVVRQVRRDTMRILEAAEPSWLTFAPEGTSNHLLWHAGHILWVQDAITAFLLTGTLTLPDEWGESFGMDCRPVATTKTWPAQADMLSALETQKDQLVQQLQAVSDERLGEVAASERGPLTVADRIIHACHDEAKHSGEMYLLLKLCRSGNHGR